MVTKEEGVTIPCTVWPGLFSHERGIKVNLPGVENLVAFVDQKDVIVSEEPVPENGIEGRCRVFVVELEGDLAIVDLPQPSVDRGTRFKIHTKYLEGHTA